MEITSNEYINISQATSVRSRSILIDIKPSNMVDKILMWCKIKRSSYEFKITPPTMATRIAYSAVLGDISNKELSGDDTVVHDTIRKHGNVVLEALIIAIHNNHRSEPSKSIRRALLTLSVEQIVVVIQAIEEMMDVGFFLRCTELIRSMALPSSSISSK